MPKHVKRSSIAFLLVLAPSALGATGCAAQTDVSAGVASPASASVIATGAPPEPSTSSPPSSTASDESPEQRRDRHRGRATGWIVTGVGIGAGVLALGTSYLMLKDKSDRDSNCPNKACNATGATANSALSDLGGWNVGAWVVAAAGLGVGTFLLFTNPADPESKTQVGLAPAPGGGGLTLRSSF